MYSQLPDYADFRGFDLSIATDLAVISKRICEWFAKPSRLTLKHHLFSTHMPKKSPKSIRAISLNDSECEFKQEMLRRGVAKIPISKTSNEIAEMDFVDYGRDATRPRVQDTFAQYVRITFIGARKHMEETSGNVAREVLTNWVCFEERRI